MTTAQAPDITFGLLTDDEDVPVATCVRERIHPELFFPTVPDAASATVLLDVRAAAACLSCPLAVPCRAYAERERTTGCWGGVVLDVYGERRPFVMVTPDGEQLGTAEVLDTSVSLWRERYAGRKGFTRRGRVPNRPASAPQRLTALPLPD